MLDDAVEYSERWIYCKWLLIKLPISR